MSKKNPEPDPLLEEKVYVQQDETGQWRRLIHRKIGGGGLHPHYVEHPDLYDHPVFMYFEVHEELSDEAWPSLDEAHAAAVEATGAPVYVGPHVSNATRRDL